MTVINALPGLQDNIATGTLEWAFYIGSYFTSDVSGKTPGDLSRERTQAVVMRRIYLL